eukprot:TRINITY_DN3093_c0_g1_i2.p1 TRINITY_DN3093_c0_g1~~TRINITY_DN3093_c0_g1_i2.p1  ORF type:complete len:121 (+),score=25.92 TRINITY_DN3093_c0_g1_i2:241-603(+)
MAYIGRQQSIMDSKWYKGTGLLSWILWRSVYLTRLEFIKNKFQVPFEWLRTFIWGRDVTTFGDQITKRYQKKKFNITINPTQSSSTPTSSTGVLETKKVVEIKQQNQDNTQNDIILKETD